MSWAVHSFFYFDSERQLITALVEIVWLRKSSLFFFSSSKLFMISHRVTIIQCDHNITLFVPSYWALKQWEITDFCTIVDTVCTRKAMVTVPIKIDCHEKDFCVLFSALVKKKDNWRQPMNFVRHRNGESAGKLLDVCCREGQNWKLKIVISWEEIPSFNCVWLKRTSAHSGFFGTLFRYVSCPARRVCETHKAESAKNPKNHQEMINLKSLNSIRSLAAHKKKTRTFRHRWFPHTLWIEHNTTHSRAIDMFIINKQSDGIISCVNEREREEVNEFLMARKFIVDTRKKNCWASIE